MEILNTRFLNKKIAVYSSGQEYNNSIVCLHGNSVHAGFFNPLTELLVKNKFKVITFDLPGHGNSEKWSSTEYSMRNLVALFLSIIGKYGTNNTNLIGFSLGGVFLIELLPFVDKSVKVAIAGSPPINTPDDIPLAYFLNEKVMNVFRGDYEISNAEDFYSSILSYANNNYKKEILGSLMATDPEFRVQCGRIMGEINNQVFTINNFKGEICVLHAEYDAVVNLNYLKGLRINNLWKNEIQIIKNCGHGFFLDNPHDLADTLTEFFS
jgi:pimeloyl-ACP methyl ester carboxylesterase